MLRIAVCVSGGGTNLQAIIDAIGSGKISNTEIVRVISNKKDAYALTRAAENGIGAVCVSRKDFPDKESFNDALIQAVDEAQPDLVVLAGFLVVLPEKMIQKYRRRIINIHPSLIPSFCGNGFYGLKVHEAAFILWTRALIQAPSSSRRLLRSVRAIHRRYFRSVLWNRLNGRSFRRP